jgi:uncharacterized membrane protein YgcG
MRRPFTQLRWLVLLALGLVAGACKQPDSILFVTVFGPIDLMPNQLGVNVTVGDMETHNILVAHTDPTETIALPASFTVALASSLTGPIIISINANVVHGDGTFETIGFGGTMMQHIHLGGQTDLSVQLMEGLPPDMPDAGTGGSGGNGGGGGAGGTSGSDGGAGAGPGDASGKEGGGDAEDATGLDAATE